jgi:phytoene/squalene synthetase
MATQYDVSAVQGAVRYSGRRGRSSAAPSDATAKVSKNSPVWPLSAIIFLVAWTHHSFWFSIAAVIAQLAVMTAGQWLWLYVQRNASRLGLRTFRSIPALRAIRLGTFALALGLVSLFV